jgi:hypothetical protein
LLEWGEITFAREPAVPVCHIHWVDASGSHAWRFDGDSARSEAEAMRASLMEDPGTTLIVLWGREFKSIAISKITRQADGQWKDAPCTPQELDYIRRS